MTTHQDIISAMVAEHLQNEQAADEAKRKAEKDLVNRANLMQHRAMKAMAMIGFLKPEEIVALFEGSMVKIDGSGDYPIVELASVVLPVIRARVDLRDADTAVLSLLAPGVRTDKVLLTGPEERQLALTLIAEAYKLERQRQEANEYSDRMRSQS